MTDAPENLDVFLRDGRNYIQGTQLIGRAAKALRPGVWRLKQAQFNRITRNEVALSVHQPDDPALGSVQFKAGDETVRFHFVERSTAAAARTDPMPIAFARSNLLLEEDTASYAVDFPGTLEDSLNALVQSVKTEHKIRFNKAYDIWFTGIRSSDIPCVLTAQHVEATLEVSLLRDLARVDQHQTMWDFHLELGDGDVWRGMMTFAYKNR